MLRINLLVYWLSDYVYSVSDIHMKESRLPIVIISQRSQRASKRRRSLNVSATRDDAPDRFIGVKLTFCSGHPHGSFRGRIYGHGRFSFILALVCPHFDHSVDRVKWNVELSHHARQRQKIDNLDATLNPTKPSLQSPITTCLIVAELRGWEYFLLSFCFCTLLTNRIHIILS